MVFSGHGWYEHDWIGSRQEKSIVGCRTFDPPSVLIIAMSLHHFRATIIGSVFEDCKPNRIDIYITCRPVRFNTQTTLRLLLKTAQAEKKGRHGY